LVQFIEWTTRHGPAAWPVSEDPGVLAQIRIWLDEAGTRPGHLRRLVVGDV
jgi:hypothetical protein